MSTSYEHKSNSDLIATLKAHLPASAVAHNDLLTELDHRLHQRDASLEEIEFLTKKMITLNERFQETEKVQSGFLSLIKNEFNNPMSVLLLLSKRLSKNIENSDDRKKMIKLMRTDLLRMDFQLKNIFAITEVEGGEIGNNYANVMPNEVFNECQEALEPIIEDKHITIRFNNDLNGYFVTDSAKFYHIIVNLLSNAIEFSFPNKEVTLKMSMHDDKIRIEVKNFGEGMHKVNKQEVYNRFTRFEIGNTRESTGLGLGLSVVKAYVDALEGSIDYECKEGSVLFWVELPLKDSNEENVSEDDVFFDAFDNEDSVSF